MPDAALLSVCMRQGAEQGSGCLLLPPQFGPGEQVWVQLEEQCIGAKWGVEESPQEAAGCVRSEQSGHSSS